MAARAMGLIRALLKETRPCPPAPLGGCWSSIPYYRQPAFSPSTQARSSQWGQTLQKPQSLHTRGAPTQCHIHIQHSLPHFHFSMPSHLFTSYTQVQKVMNDTIKHHFFLKTYRRETCLETFTRKHRYNMKRSCVHACKPPTACCFVPYQ